MDVSSAASLKEHYDTHGYVIVRGLVTPSENAHLLAATERAAARTRSGSWPHARVVGKQFPPYGDGDDVWGVQHAMHPALGEPAFARWYAGDAVRGAAKTLLGCQDDHLQMGTLRARAPASALRTDREKNRTVQCPRAPAPLRLCTVLAS